MSISAKLAEALLRINALVPHREEGAKLEIDEAIKGEAAPEQADDATPIYDNLTHQED